MVVHKASLSSSSSTKQSSKHAMALGPIEVILSYLFLLLLHPVSSQTCNNEGSSSTCEENENETAAPSQIIAFFRYLHVPLVVTIRGARISTVYIFQSVGAFIVIASCIIAWKYRRAMKRKMEELGTKAANIRLVRKKSVSRVETTIDGDSMAAELNLSPTYQQRHAGEVKIMSLADYLSSLEPVGPLGSVKEEMEVLIGAALLRLLGPHMGAYLLPSISAIASTVPWKSAAGASPSAPREEAVGGGDTTTGLASASKESRRASFVASGVLKENAEEGTANTSGNKNKTVVTTAAIQTPSAAVKALSGSSLLFMMGMTDAATTIKKFLSNGKEKEEEILANTLMKQGEASAEPIPSDLLPNPFILSEHWGKAIEGMEKIMHASDFEKDTYDPNGFKVAEPTAVQDRLLPDLYVGFGHAKRTLTNRVCVQNRVFSVLMNKLASNFLAVFHEKEDGKEEKEEIFAVKMTTDGKTLTRPWDFVDALIQSGHEVESCSRTRLTSFSLALCVKEGGTTENPEFVHIPLSVCISPGLESRDGHALPTFLPHGGLDLDITGPIVEVHVQHYQSNTGFNGWFCNAYWDLPWAKDAVDCGPTFRGADATRSTLIAALSAAIMNDTSTEFKLPLGGYGLVGVCNDNAGVIELAMTGKTHVFPMIGVGKYVSHSVRKGRKFVDTLQNAEKISFLAKRGLQIDDITVKEAKNLLKAMMDLPNDVHVTPKDTCDAAKRMLHCIPEDMPFRLLEETREKLGVLIEESQYW